MQGKAKDDVQYVEITEASYDETWNKLKEKYDKKKLIVTALIKRFLDQPPSTEAVAGHIRQIADTSDEILRGLKITGEEAESRDPWLIYILLNKLDADTRLAWARETSNDTFPKITDFIKFLNKRCDDFEVCQSAGNKTCNKPRTRAAVNKIMQISSYNCIKCNGNHRLFNCKYFLEMDARDRRGFVADKRLCFICLSGNHQSRICNSPHRCKTCKRRHNSLLHFEEENNEMRIENSSDIPVNKYQYY